MTVPFLETCSACSNCQDLDLTRDSRLIEGNWTCTECSHPDDMSVIEGRLIEQLATVTKAYQLQDLSCKKCKQVCMEPAATPFGALHTTSLSSAGSLTQPHALPCCTATAVAD